MGTLLDMVHTHLNAVQTGDLDRSESLYAEDILTETPSGVMEGREAFRAFGQAFLTAVPDMTFTIRDSWEIGDTVIVEGTYSGTQTGPMATPDGVLPPSGKSFSFPFVDIFVARDGKFVSHRGYWDNLTFLGQIGALPTPEAAQA